MTRLHRSMLAVAVLASGLLTATAAWGSELYSSPVPAPAAAYRLPVRETMQVDLEVLVDGQPVRLISHEGRLYLPVPRMGAQYEIRVNNQGPRRIEAVVSVDGLSVISGRPASERSNGYIVAANSQVVIKGWRRNLDTVAAFTFERPEESYANRMGYRGNLGVIGLTAFEEQVSRVRPLDMPMDFSAPKSKYEGLTPGAPGTGWGHDITSGVVEVPFVRSGNKRTMTIYYDTVEALRRLGVPVDVCYPKPFPANTDFCPPPPAKR